MAHPAIRVAGLGKEYHIGSKPERYTSLRDTLVRVAKAPFQRAAAVMRGRSSVLSSRTFWALRDVTFDI